MSVTNYTPDKCRYYIGKLEDIVYLVSEDALKDIKIDNGNAFVASVSESPLSIKCYNLKLAEEESFDERYKFTHTVTFSVNGYMNKDNFNDKYYVILKDVEGTYWLVNPLFPSKVTYNYKLGYNENHTDFTLATASNHPVLRLNEFNVDDVHECEAYWYDGIVELKLNEKKYSAHIDNHIKYTNASGFKDVDFNDRTCVVTEEFDGENVRHQIDFNIMLSQYKNDWHYSLLEFKDNTYAAVFKTLNEKYGLCGFSMGLQPSFTIDADSESMSNTIKITLKDAHTDGLTLDFYDSVDYEYLSAKTWVYTADYGGYECIGEGTARYLLKKEVDAFDNETGNYMVLDGYESYFQESSWPVFHIAGTFETTETFSNMECMGSDCALNASFPSQIEFYEEGCQNFYVEADSNWIITPSKDYITVSPSSGLAHTAYDVVVCNTMQPTDTADTSTLTIEYCSTSSTVNITVVEDPSACFQQGGEFFVTAEEQTINITTKCCIDNAREISQYGVLVTVFSNYITVYIPENNTGSKRDIIILTNNCDGTTSNVIIHQDNVFEEWRNTDIRFCIYNNEYRHQIMYSGHTRQTMVATTEERDTMVKEDSDFCKGLLYRWVDTGESGCTGCDCDNFKYNANNAPTKPMPSNQALECQSILNKSKIIFANPIYGAGSGIYDICINDSVEEISIYNESGETYDSYFGILEHGSFSEVVLPSGLKTLQGGFDMTRTLENIIIPPGITSLGAYCFYYCDSLESAIIQSENLTNIGYQCFNCCYNLKTLILFSTTVPTLGSDVFAHTHQDLKIYVPSSALASYKTSPGWADISNKIHSIN